MHVTVAKSSRATRRARPPLPRLSSGDWASILVVGVRDINQDLQAQSVRYVSADGPGGPSGRTLWPLLVLPV